ncbi:hypothetical protein HOE22_11650 [Candidatus Woesearchaeota archaeon]|jgi:hypothetical protein|nr:hypothetical protein [Candidatus Woesearchaeota archaeon]MBT4208973.1 hypothetical protein [Candidatus Woesearchaeota archaeon]MBT5043254.1 hypothetical protein [Candidatus Woesearchaeota archaeon]MBT5558181.1 hypothetical protein [Candidatus Woesearchaeota archaeon]MBT6761099.1 hypothetical protein [Candidatus Woesearchaeota archaeon]
MFATNLVTDSYNDLSGQQVFNIQDFPPPLPPFKVSTEACNCQTLISQIQRDKCAEWCPDEMSCKKYKRAVYECTGGNSCFRERFGPDSMGPSGPPIFVVVSTGECPNEIATPPPEFIIIDKSKQTIYESKQTSPKP